MPIFVYDNGGETVDRYTIIIDTEVFGMSENALSPNGFNQYCGRVGDDIPIGRFDDEPVIGLRTLPRDVLLAIIHRLSDMTTDPV